MTAHTPTPLQAVPDPPSPAPPVAAPDGLGRAGAALWRAVRAEMQAGQAWTAATEPLAEAFVRSVVVARRARGRLGDRLTDEGSTGQTVPHALLRVARDAERDAQRLAAELRLTPASRLEPPEPPDDGDLDEILAIDEAA